MAGLDVPVEYGPCKCPGTFDCEFADIKGVEYGQRGPPSYKPRPDESEVYVQKEMHVEEFRSDALRRSQKINEYRNLNRCIHSQRRQCEEIEKNEKAIKELALKERDMEEVNNLSRELATLNRNELREAKLRQQLRSNSHELQELERKLKAAYINKELAAQIAQHEAEKLNEKIHLARAHEAMMKASVTERQYLDQLKQDDIIKKAAYKKELQGQLIMREKSKRYLYEEFLREKKLIDEVVRRIHDEDEREREERMRKKKRTRDEIEAVRKAQAEWKMKRIEEIDEEDRKIREYLLSRNTQQQSQAKIQAEKEAKRDRIIEKIASDLVEEREARKERDDIIQDLREEELRAKLDQRLKEEIEMKVRNKLEVKRFLTVQMQDTKERVRLQKEEDRKYKEELIAKLTEDDKLEQLSSQKRRLKMTQMRKDIENLLAERRAKQAEEYQLQLGLEEDERKEAELRKQIIEEERIKILKEHVHHLIGYLPKGLLRTEDLPHLGSDVIESLESVNHMPNYIPPIHGKK